MRHQALQLKKLANTLCPIIFGAILSACIADNRQSMLHAASDTADDIAFLWWLMLAMFTVVFVGVMIALGISILIKKQDNAEALGGNRRWIMVGGIALPGVSVVILLIIALRVTTVMPDEEADLVVEVVGRNWWWEVRYPGHDVISANEIYLPQGAVVRFELSATEVIHSFWVPALHGKMDMLPDHVNELLVQPREIGRFRGVCAEFCGIQHALMAIYVVVLSEEDFEDWLLARQVQAVKPLSPLQSLGKEIYFLKGCDTCHRIRGTEALGAIGPDLTHIGSRLSLGAGTVDYSKSALADFIRDAQTIKPGNAMPATVIDEKSLEALVEYLDALK